MNKWFLTSILMLCSFQQFILAMQPEENPKLNWQLMNGQSKKSNLQIIQSIHKQICDYATLRYTVVKQDYAETQQLLAHGIDPNPPQDEIEPIRYARSIALAKLLLAHGALIPADILSKSCLDKDYPLELIKFFLARGFKFKYGLYLLSKMPTVYVPARQRYFEGLEYGYSMMGNEKIYINPQSEASEELDLRLAKARLFLENDCDLYDQNISYGKATPLHRAAQKHDMYYCRFLVDYETVTQKQFLAFLLYLKYLRSRLYLQKDLLRNVWLSLTPQKLINMKDAKDKTAYDYVDPFFKKNCEWLKPK